MSKKNNQKHGFHLVDISPWPLLLSFSALMLTFGPFFSSIVSCDTTEQLTAAAAQGSFWLIGGALATVAGCSFFCYKYFLARAKHFDALHEEGHISKEIQPTSACKEDSIFVVNPQPVSTSEPLYQISPADSIYLQDIVESILKVYSSNVPEDIFEVALHIVHSVSPEHFLILLDFVPEELIPSLFDHLNLAGQKTPFGSWFHDWIKSQLELMEGNVPQHEETINLPEPEVLQGGAVDPSSFLNPYFDWSFILNGIYGFFGAYGLPLFGGCVSLPFLAGVGFGFFLKVYYFYPVFVGYIPVAQTGIISYCKSWKFL